MPILSIPVAVHQRGGRENSCGRAGDAPLLVIGLSRENTVRLLAGQPIMMDCGDLGLPTMKVIIVGGETEQTILGDLQRLASGGEYGALHRDRVSVDDHCADGDGVASEEIGSEGCGYRERVRTPRERRDLRDCCFNRPVT